MKLRDSMQLRKASCAYTVRVKVERQSDCSLRIVDD